MFHDDVSPWRASAASPWIALDRGWEMATLAPGAAVRPSALPADARWHPAPVPGTLAEAARRAGAWSLGAPLPDDADAWFRLALPACGPRRLRFEGLATAAEGWLDDEPLLLSDSMFVAHERDADLSRPRVLHLRFRPLRALLDARRGRGRWRAGLVDDARLRSVRTSLLGHMPGCCPPVPATGPWRPVLLLDPSGPPAPVRAELHAAMRGPDGRVSARIVARGATGATRATFVVGDAEAVLRPAGDASGPGEREFRGELVVPRPAAWWPHTHGEPRRHPAAVRLDGAEFPLDPVGFRAVELDRGPDGRGFALRVNGEPVFCRGACWGAADIASLAGDAAACRPWLEAARDAGMNMIRVPGTAVYEGDGFYALCDELGLLVWQDFMFACLDYPAEDPAFAAAVETEARQFLGRTRGRACLAVLCGGSEVAQQAAMLGAPPERWSGPLFDALLPGIAASLRPDVPYVPHTPGGDGLPVRPDAGVAHYFGVGAYLRPPDDARRAGVRFAAECLAFSNVPCQATLDERLPVPPVHHPRWKERVPRDPGASWDFEDVRDHYLELLWGVDARMLRRERPRRYLDLSRAVTGELMAMTFAEWRRPGSSCAGGLVLQLQDFWPGAGWGVLDALGRPKPAWHALRRCLQPVQVLLADEGLNGLAVHAVNETAAPVRGRLELAWFGEDGDPPPASRAVEIPPRGGVTLSDAALIGRFRDLGHAYRFGPPPAAAVRARLHGPGVESEAWLFPRGFAAVPPAGALVATPERHGDGWRLAVQAERLALGLHLDDPGFAADDEWFHLPPGGTRTLRLRPLRADAAVPEGELRALNGGAAAYRG